MATGTEIEKKLKDLEAKLLAGQITPTDYQEKRTKLIKQLEEAQVFETSPPFEESTEGERRISLQEKLGGYDPAYGRIEESIEETVKRLEKQVGRDLFTTREYEDTIPASTFISNVRDPEKGLVIDPKTRKVGVAKGKKIDKPALSKVFAASLLTPAAALVNLVVPDEISPSTELLLEGMKRQVLLTPEQKRIQDDQIDFSKKQESRRRKKERIKQGMTAEQADTARSKEKVFEMMAERKKKPISKKQVVDAARVISPALAPVIEATAGDEDLFTEQIQGYVVESPLAWGFRMLNLPSAGVATVIDKVNDKVIAPITGAPVKTRKGAGYRRIAGGPGFIDDSIASQTALNFLTGQGVMSQLGAQSLPNDIDYNALTGVDDHARFLTHFLVSQYNPAVEGTAANIGVRLASEQGIPATPLGAVTGAVKGVGTLGKGVKNVGRLLRSGNLQKAGMIINNPFEAVRYAGAKAELQQALKVSRKSGADLEKEIVKNGGTLNKQSLRAKAAESIADTYAGVESLKQRVKQEQLRRDFYSFDNENIFELDTIKKSDFKSNSPFLNSVFKDGEISLDEAKRIIKTWDDKFKEFGVEQEIPSIRGAYQTTERTSKAVDNVFNVDKGLVLPKDDIIRPSVYSSILNDIDFKGLESDVYPEFKSLKNTPEWKRASDLLDQQHVRALKPRELDKLSNALNVLEKKGFFKKLGALQDVLTDSHNLKYDAVRSSVKQVLQDNFLKNISDDYVYVSQQVAVPLSSRISKLGKETDAFKDYKRVNQRFKKYTPMGKNGDLFLLDSFSALRMLSLQARKGFKIPDNIKKKLESVMNGSTSSDDAFTLPEIRSYEDIVNSELAMDMLDGVRLKSGGLTEEMARLDIAQRDTLFSPVASYTSSFKLKARSFANAIKIMTQNMTGKSFDFFPSTSPLRLPAGFNRFNRAYIESSQAAFRQVMSEFEQARVASPKDPTEAIVKVSEKYFDMGIELQIGQQPVNISQKNLINSTSYGDLAKEKTVSINTISDNMQEFSVPLAKHKQWKQVIELFFQKGEGGVSTAQKRLSQVYEDNALWNIVTINKQQSIFDVNNIKPINPYTLAEVVEELRSKYPVLKRKGLRANLLFKDEAYMLPILEMANRIQLQKNMQQSINAFAQSESDVLLDMTRTQQNMIGLRSTTVVADKLEKQLRSNLSQFVDAGLTSDEVIDLSMAQIREILFDGMSRDVWVNLTREKQLKFLQKFLNQTVQEGSPPTDVDGWIQSLYRDGTLTSETFNNVKAKAQSIIDNLKSNLDELELGQREQLDRVKIELDEVLDDMESQYLTTLTGSTDGYKDTLFTEQMQQVYDYITRYGISGESLKSSIEKSIPRIEYIGNKNIMFIYGSNHDNIVEKINTITENKAFDKLFKMYSLRGDQDVNVLRQAFTYLGSVASFLRRLTFAGLLGGVDGVTTRFFGNNRFTSLFLMAPVLTPDLRASSVSRIIGASLTPGFTELVNRFFQSINKPNIRIPSLVKSDRMMYAPANEVIIKQSDGALRDYTAGEIRSIINDKGIEYSRADLEVFDTELNQLLAASDVTISGKARNRFMKVTDYFNPNVNLLTTNLGKYQDSINRRAVFVAALESGRSVDQAAALSKMSMLDYTAFKSTDKDSFFRKVHNYTAKYIPFYAFQVSMGTNMINALYKGSKVSKPNLSLKLLRSQDLLNREMAQDYYDYTDANLGRVFNIWSGTVDDIDTYASGPPNPQIQMFDIFTNAAILGMASFDNMTAEEQQSELQLLNGLLDMTTKTIFQVGVEDRPVVGELFKYYKADTANRVSGTRFPSHLQYECERSGNMPYCIDMYGLVKAKKRPGVPLTSTGDYYDFSDTPQGVKGFKLYQVHRILGMMGLGMVIRNNFKGAEAASSRASIDAMRAELFAAQQSLKLSGAEGVESVTIPTQSRYLKTAVPQGGAFKMLDTSKFSSTLYILFLSGLATPTKSRSPEQEMKQLQKRVDSILKTEKRETK